MHLQCNSQKKRKKEKQITVNDLYSVVVYLKLKCVIMFKTCNLHVSVFSYTCYKSFVSSKIWDEVELLKK